MTADLVRNTGGDGQRLEITPDSAGWEYLSFSIHALRAGSSHAELRPSEETAIVPLAGSKARLHLRPVRHGGWFGGLLGAKLLGSARPLRELRVTAALAERGAPVARPVLVVAERSGAQAQYVSDAGARLVMAWFNDPDPTTGFMVPVANQVVRTDRWVDDDQDGIDQISELLQQYDQLDAVHILSHGSQGAVKLGDTWLTDDNVAGYAAQLTGWRDALAADADLLLYGCRLAGNAGGAALVDALHELTGADVAASVDDSPDGEG